jgi:hypothetical protein
MCDNKLDALTDDCLEITLDHLTGLGNSLLNFDTCGVAFCAERKTSPIPGAQTQIPQLCAARSTRDSLTLVALDLARFRFTCGSPRVHASHWVYPR